MFQVNSGEQKLFLFAHSMGGAIGADFLEEYPEYFNSAILSAPMFQVNTGICFLHIQSGKT